MLGIGIVGGLLGYGILYWGLQLWSGCTQNTFLDIMWPGGQKFTPCQPTTSTGTGPPATAQGTGGGPGGLLGQGTGNSLPPGTAPQLGGHS